MEQSLCNEIEKAYFDCYECKRLTADADNKELVKQFENKTNNKLAEIIRDEAWDEDISGKLAYYIVRDKVSHEIVLYFSLKCGLLSDDLDESHIKLFENMPSILQAFDDNQYEKIIEIAQKIEISATKIINNINVWKRLSEIYREDMETYADKDVVRVAETHSAVELVHLCKNENYKKEWKVKIPKGACAFWFNILPKLNELRNIVGCEYIYLFAADGSEDKDLCNYYNNDLGFDEIDMKTIKPIFDFTCFPMFQSIDSLNSIKNDKINYLYQIVNKQK